MPSRVLYNIQFQGLEPHLETSKRRFRIVERSPNYLERCMDPLNKTQDKSVSSVCSPMSPSAFCGQPLPSRRHLVRSPHSVKACQQHSPLPRYQLAPHLTRRHVLSITAALAGATLLPEHAEALSKKRIMAKAGPPTELPSGVTYRDITVGKGNSPRNGDTVAIHYSLFYRDLEVESSRESQGLAASPIGFTYGTTSGPGSIMRGVLVGMEGMKVGGLRLISVPPELAYGEKGRLPLIPGNSTVDFAVSLLSCKRSGTNPISTIDPKAQAY